MIVVLADDFSGAAEIAGAASCHELAAEVQIDFDPVSVADVLVVDTNTRSLPTTDAAERAGAIATQVLQSQPTWLFKKVDSLLRGPVLAEIEAVRRALDLPRVVLAVSNPSLGRVVSEGRLLVHNTPVAQTDLARDPEHPIRSSEVAEILGSPTSSSIHPLRVDEPLPETGILIADATCADHLVRLAKAIDSQTLAVGAAEFFGAVLSAREDRPPVDRPSDESGCKVQPPRDGRELLFCGSLAAWDSRQQECQQAKIPVLVPPVDSMTDEDRVDRWLPEAKGTLRDSRRAMIALGGIRGPFQQPHLLVSRLAAVVARLVDEMDVTRLLVEGGATASALVRFLGWSRLRVVSVPAPGVVELDVLDEENAPRLLVKPGSYDWPTSVQQSFFCTRDKNEPD